MKRNIICFIFILLSPVLVYAGTFTNVQEPMGTNNGAMNCAIAFGDIDLDGDLDIAIAGSDGANKRFIIFRNDGGIFTNVQEPIGTNKGFIASSIAFGDYDMDGDLDIALAGQGNPSTSRFIIFRNDTGTFINVQEPMGINQGVFHSSIAFGDYDLDGDLDIALTGTEGMANRRFIIFRNDDGTFTNIQEPMGQDKGVRSSSIAYGDYDKDGDLDIALTGDDGPNERFIIFRNDAGKFTNVQEPMGQDKGVSDSYETSIAYGDYDQDGDLDIALTGNDGANERFIIFRNDAGTFTKVQEPMGANKGVHDSSIAFGDYDMDGDLDLALTGHDGLNNRFIIFRNDAGTFINVEEPMGIDKGVSASSIAFGDYDMDGDLDIALTGSDGTNCRFIIYKNTMSGNNPPAIPGNMVSTNIGGYWRFIWSVPFDDHTLPKMMRYKIAIGINNSGCYDYTSDAVDYPRGQANIGNIPQGWISATQCFYQSKIPAATKVYWKVAAIDTSFKLSWSGEQVALMEEESLENDEYTISDIVLVPNPFNPYKIKKKYITFFNVPDDVNIKIYNIMGNKLKELKCPDLKHQITWDSSDSSGKLLSRGVYAAVLKDSKGNSRHIKFVIQR